MGQGVPVGTRVRYLTNDDSARKADSQAPPEVEIGGSTIQIPELLEYSLPHEVRFKRPLQRVGREFLFTGSILMAADGRLYFIPSGEFEGLESIAHADLGD